ncbi:succinate-semialdehyde dehydrogenase [Klebsiella pneumoniae subsp. ozaenae]|uniref:Succinate-semialdehyde dehydrogenase n=1 Tax=Klebsiella pneumoniae subsp. ozaenae TaxID=574 RepID=A0A377ZQG0_KLEPO|nr:succinate-semialdehyde dehydrogenase [Klebsiella pneumoniae subsp. ozaenae]
MMNLSATHAVSVNPTTGEVVSSLPWASEREVDAAIALAAAGYRQWRQTPLADRADALRRIGAALRARGEEVAQMITLEMGKPIAQARGEVAKSANLCDWYAEHGPAMLATEATLVENNQAVIEYRPLGAILAGDAVELPGLAGDARRGADPAGRQQLSAEACPERDGQRRLLGEIFAAAGLPDGVFGWVNATNDGVSQIINDDRIAAVTVTGSVRAGKAIGAQAGAALKKCVLELGGSDPFIVLNDADLDEAVKAAVTGRYQNSGQVCAASKRFILEAGIAEAFTRKFVDAVAALKMGDPRDEQNYVGPMARFDLRDELHQQVTATLDEGRLCCWARKKSKGGQLLCANGAGQPSPPG